MTRSFLQLLYCFLVISLPIMSTTSTGGSIVKAMAAAVAVRVRNSGVPSVNVEYSWKSAHSVPPGFTKVCQANSWSVDDTWQRLNNGREWLCSTSNDAYIYFNAADGHWWIDEPEGMGVFIAPSEGGGNEKHLPPVRGWQSLSQDYLPLPDINVVFPSDEDGPVNS